MSIGKVVKADPDSGIAAPVLFYAASGRIKEHRKV
jgi:hypothetical protein